MSILNTFRSYVADQRARRRRMRTYLEIASLPREIQKDIGWLPDHRTWRTARRQGGDAW